MKKGEERSGAGTSSKTVDNFPVNNRLELERTQITVGVPVHSNLQHALRARIDIAEIMVACATYQGSNIKYLPIQKLITYPLDRRIYFEIIAHLETELQIFDEEELYACVAYVKSEIEKIDIKSINKEILTKTDVMTDEIMSRIKAGDHSTDEQGYRAMYDTIMSNFSNNRFAISEKFKQEHHTDNDLQAVEILARMAISDMIYQKNQKEAIDSFAIPAIEQIISTAIDQNTNLNVDTGEESYVIQMKRLSIHPGDQRQTFLLAGAPACGKGSILEKVLTKAHLELKIDPSDIVKINTDSHRVLVSQSSDLGGDKKLHVSLNNDESSFITTLAYDKMKDKIANNAAPHMLIDGVAPSRDRIQLGLNSDGNLDITVVTLDVNESLERAYARGEKSGRFVQTDYLVRSHQVVSQEVINLIKDQSLQDRSAKLTIYDNNDIAVGEEPTFVVEVDFKTKRATVGSADLFMNFHDKIRDDHLTTKERLDIIKRSSTSSEEKATILFQTAGLADNLSSRPLDAPS